MKPKTLLEMVQDILESLSSSPVNSISESSEAIQVATFIKNTYENLFTNKKIPDFEGLVKLEVYSDNRYPTFLRYPDSIKELKLIWYDIRPDGFPDPDHVHYKEILYLCPEDFLRRLNYSYDDTTAIVEPETQTTLYVRNNADPSYWTTFDNKTIIFDSYDKAKDDTIQESKLRALGAYYPEFRMEDAFIPRLNALYFPLLLAESKSLSFSLLKGYIDPKVEQMARRQRYFIQDDLSVHHLPPQWNDYGRRGPAGRRSRI